MSALNKIRRLDKVNPAKLAINAAYEVIELLEGNVYLTDAGIHLENALKSLESYILENEKDEEQVETD